MDDIERLIREARPESGTRDRPLSARAERELDALVGKKHHRRVAVFALAAVVVAAVAIGVPLLIPEPESRVVAGPAEIDPSTVLHAAAEKLGATPSAHTGDEAGRLLDGQGFTPEAQAFLLASIERNGSAVRAERGTEDGYAVWRVTLDDGELVIRIDTGRIVLFIDAAGREHRP